MTHRSSAVRSRIVYACWRSLNVDRCALLALPLSNAVVASWRLSHWSLTSRLSSASRSSHETTPTLRHRRYSCSLSRARGLSFDYFFHFISCFYPITVSAFYVCTCFLVLVALLVVVSPTPSIVSSKIVTRSLYIVKYPPYSGFFTRYIINTPYAMQISSRMVLRSYIRSPLPVSVPPIAIAVPPRLICPSSSSSPSPVHRRRTLSTAQCFPL
jgi:hypothetical protein